MRWGMRGGGMRWDTWRQGELAGGSSIDVPGRIWNAAQAEATKSAAMHPEPGAAALVTVLEVLGLATPWVHKVL